MVRLLRPLVLISFLLLNLAAPAFATNGMNPIGYGAVSLSMGGADLAIVDNASAMNINPAGICECASPELDFGISLLMPKMHHEDALGNDTDATDQVFPLPFVAYVHPVGRWSLGVGLFAQGGMGAEYEDLTTPFAVADAMGQLPPGQTVPPTDDTFSNVMYLKFTPTVAYRPSPRLSLGASLQLGYASTDLKYFPNSSVYVDQDMDMNPEMAFFGMDLKKASGFGYAVRLGFQYRVGALTIGGAYLSPSKLNLDNGTMTLNMEAAGLGKVDYDAKLDGFDWPQQVGLGVSYRFAPWLLVAADVDWIDWSNAIDTVEIKLDNPDNEMAQDSMTIPFEMDWKDQWVYALGVEIRPSLRWALRFGYNHGKSPVPDATLSPLFPAIVEDHLTGGLGYTWGQWVFDAGLVYGLEGKQTNSDPSNPFMESTEKHSQITTSLAVRYVF